MNLYLRLCLCIAAAAFFLYAYVDEQNRATRLRLQIPIVAKEVRALKEANTRLKYQIELFESPQNLLTLSSQSAYTHLQHPLISQVVCLPEGFALCRSTDKVEPFFSKSQRIVTGTLPYSQ
jgi:hypothetical protein